MYSKKSGTDKSAWGAHPHCGVIGPKGMFSCTRERDHLGPHLAGIGGDNYCAEWDDDRSTDDVESSTVSWFREYYPNPISAPEPYAGRQCPNRHHVSPTGESSLIGWVCTLPKGHSGPCLAGIRGGKAVAAWQMVEADFFASLGL